ncbi:MAG: hypothetical protein RBR38_10395 [Desulfomicrobium apsheronum]|nr:hypothetical protein [Desulfomicrobium apsheronum]
MTHAEIRAAIVANGWQGEDAGEIAALLNEPKVVLVECMAELGTPMKYLGAEAGAALLDQMEALAATNPTVKWGLKLLERGALDLSLDSTRAMLDELLPVDAATVLKGLAEQTVTAGVTVQQVIDAMEGI